MIYKTCSICGAHLDPGERCDCDGHDVPELEEAQRKLPKRPAISQEEFYAREAEQRYRRFLLT